MSHSFVTTWTVAHQTPLSKDFPGKNPGMDCYFLLQGTFWTQGSNSYLMNWQVESLPLSHQGGPLKHSRACLFLEMFFTTLTHQKCKVVVLSRVQLCETPRTLVPPPPPPWNSPDKNTGVDSHSLLLGIFPTQGSNLGLLHCRQILYYLSRQGKWKIYSDTT